MGIKTEMERGKYQWAVMSCCDCTSPHWKCNTAHQSQPTQLHKRCVPPFRSLFCACTHCSPKATCFNSLFCLCGNTAAVLSGSQLSLKTSSFCIQNGVLPLSPHSLYCKSPLLFQCSEKEISADLDHPLREWTLLCTKLINIFLPWVFLILKQDGYFKKLFFLTC